MPERLGSGVTRTAWKVGRWAVKIPNWGWFIRGYLANRSEWDQRHRSDVNAPLWRIGLIAVYPLAVTMDRDAADRFERDRTPVLLEAGYSQEEAKPSSWGCVDGRWLVIDFDAAWATPRRGAVGRLYYWNQERLGRKWARLDSSKPKENLDER